jgi:hypothetical protein
MTNYIIEGAVDFYKEINSIQEEEEEENRCLITGQPLLNNHIKLSCGHRFNYLPLYKEVCSQKKPSFINNFETTKLALNQMKCPYCRIKMDTLLPYMQIYDDAGVKLIARVNGVNSPERYCLKMSECAWIFKQGKDEGVKCAKNAYFNNSFLTADAANTNAANADANTNAYCDLHWKKIEIKNKKKEEVEEVWTDAMITYSKTVKVVELKKKLREKGQKVCGTKKELVQRVFASQ